MPPLYRGRFAPSPTGPLHFGSLVAAVSSYLSARRAGGEWLVRIEDLDPPREIPGSADQIIAALAAFGFEWTGSILRQSSRESSYGIAVDQLLSAGHAFNCSCTRAEISAAGLAPGNDSDELRYPGWCRNGIRAAGRALAVRFRSPARLVTFHDEIQGSQSIDVAAESGDFVLRRRDGLFAYQLAVTVDDAAQAITHVVRGADLLHSTARQILLQRALDLPAVMYAHVPVATDSDGVKLSKSAGAAAIDLGHPVEALWRALSFLGQGPPPELRQGGLPPLWQWAIEHWTPTPLRGVTGATVDYPTKYGAALGNAAKLD